MNFSLAAAVFLSLACRPAAAQSEVLGKDLGNLLGWSTARIEFVPGGDGAKEPSCTGVLVAPNVLLTAAHCWGSGSREERSAATVTFRGASAKAGEARRYDGYSGKEEDDLALLAFDASALKERKSAAPAYGAGPIKAGSTLIVGSAGPGQSGESGMPGTARLRVERVDKEKGLAYAAGEKDGSSCWSDSGSPAFLVSRKGPRLAGVVSRPNGADCKPADPVVVTLLAPRAAWLKKNIEAISHGKKADGGSTWGKSPP